MPGQNLPRRIQPIHARHGAIHHNHLGVQFLGKFDCLGAIGGLTDNRNIGFIFQDAPEAATDEAVVVHQQN